MAFGAVCVERPEVEIRVCVTGHALCRKPGKLTVCMAILTNNVDVRPIQWEIAAVVIESYIFPTRRGMAGSTVRSKTTVMFIVLAMTGITSGGQTLVNTVLMTILASDLCMLALQFEGREGMVKFGGHPTIR